MSTHIVYGEDYAEDDVTTECNETAGTAFIEITWQSGTYVLTINFAAVSDVCMVMAVLLSPVIIRMLINTGT